MAMTLSRTVYELFFENSTAYATGHLNGGNKVRYETHDEIPKLDDIESHFVGDMILGAYTVHPGTDTVSWAAFDVDSKVGGLAEARKLAEKISNFLTSKGIPHAIEFSGSKGYHIFIFFTDKEPADEVKSCMEQIREQLVLPENGDPHVEVYPKQGKLSPTNPYGNLLRLPLGKHPKTDVITFFVDTEKWEEGDALDPQEIFSRKTTLADLKKIIPETDDLEQIVTTLSPYWESGQRHDISLYLSGYFASMSVVEEEAQDIIRAIHALVPEGDLNDQLKTVTSTYKKYYAGESVVGLSKLSSILPASVLNDLHTFVGKVASPSAMLGIDRIRLGKGAAFLKVRSSAHSVLSHLIEDGRLVRDKTELYWLRGSDRKLISTESDEWDRFAHNHFGMNKADSFGKQTIEALRHLAYDRAKEVKVKRRSHWDSDSEINYMNLGGPEIYVCNGDRDKREVIYNGEIDILFKNSEDSFHLHNLKESKEDALSPWPFLTDDVNFMLGQDGTTPEQQRELSKAYLIATLFAEIMPTRPIYTVLGESGYGKTTLARRFLRVLEGPSRDVLTINQDKQDSFRASVVANRFLVLDNLERSDAKWLPDSLNRVATGADMELRKLYTTNQVQRYEINCFIAITATLMPFSEETVYTRMLPIQLGPVLGRRNENVIQSDLINNFPSIWKGILNDLDDTIAELRRVKSVVVPGDTRLADFAVFCDRIKDAPYFKDNELMPGLGNLVNRQKQILEQNTPYIGILGAYLSTVVSGDTGWLSASDLYARTQKIANLNKMEWRWTSVQALSKHIAMLEPQLIQHFGLQVRFEKENGREVKKYRFVIHKTGEKK